jgi:hypothetical protein
LRERQRVVTVSMRVSHLVRLPHRQLVPGRCSTFPARPVALDLGSNPRQSDFSEAPSISRCFPPHPGALFHATEDAAVVGGFESASVGGTGSNRWPPGCRFCAWADPLLRRHADQDECGRLNFVRLPRGVLVGV